MEKIAVAIVLMRPINLILTKFGILLVTLDDLVKKRFLAHLVNSAGRFPEKWCFYISHIEQCVSKAFFPS